MKAFRPIAFIAVILLILAIGIARYGTGRFAPVPPPIPPVRMPDQTDPFRAGTGGRSTPTARTPVQAAPETSGVVLPPGSSFPVTLNDAQGRAVTIPARPQRIVSLSPGTTELLFDLDAGDRVVADTTACDWPAEAKRKPHIGGPFDMSLESIVAQNPDLIVADGSINQKIIVTLENANQPVFVVQAKTIADTYDTIRLLGRATGDTTRAEAVVEMMQTRLEAVKKSVSKALSRPKVLIIHEFSGSGVYTTGKGSFIDDLITLAGGQNIAQTNDPLSIEKVAMEEPDVIIFPYGSSSEREHCKAISGWASVPAVRNTAFFEPSPNATLVRPSPRNALAAWELARFLHPEIPLDPIQPDAAAPASSRAGSRK